MKTIKLPNLNLNSSCEKRPYLVYDNARAYQFRARNNNGTEIHISKVGYHGKNEDPTKIDWVQRWHQKYKREYFKDKARKQIVSY